MFEDQNMTIVRHHGRGRSDPSGISVVLHRQVGDDRNGWVNRRIKMTLDELFDLTEALDDLCDTIEDQMTITKQHKEVTL